jgi:transcriptional regulator with XRE-family HTH domain
MSAVRAEADVLETVGSRIRAIRRKRKKTQEWLAQQVGVSSQAIVQYEGDQVAISAERLAQIAKALGVRPGHLFPRERPDVSP